MSKLGQKLGGAVDDIKLASPVIFLGLSIVSAVASAVTAVIATPKAIEAKNVHVENLKTIEAAHKEHKCVDGQEYTEEDYHQDNIREIVQFGAKEAVIFLPTLLLLLASGGFSIASYMIMRRRLAGAMATASAIATMFMQYRQRVIEDHGVEADQAYLHGKKSIVTKSTLKDPETGELVEVKEVSYKLDESVDDSVLLSPYAVKLDSRNPNFARCNGNTLYIMHWVDSIHGIIQQKFLNKGLFDQKLWLSEVLDAFDFSPSTHKDINWDAARVNGWMMCTKYYDRRDPNKEIKKYTGDYIISVGYDPTQYSYGDWDICKLVQDKNGDYYLDFNCWGNILYMKPVPLEDAEYAKIFDDLHRKFPDTFDR